MVRSVLVTAIPLPHTSRYYLQNVEPEARAIEAAMPADAEVFVNISVDEFRRQIDGRKIWFFVGHGDAQLLGETVPAFAFANSSNLNGLQSVSINTLVSIVRPCVLRGELELVVFTGCCTAQLATALHQKAFVPHVICWASKLHDLAGRVFGAEFAQKIAGQQVRDAFEGACAAVLSHTSQGLLDNGIQAMLQTFELVDPDDPSLVDLNTGHLWVSPPGAREGRLAAGVPRLFAPDDSMLHGVPQLPANFIERPELGDLRRALVDTTRGPGVVFGIVGSSTTGASASFAGIAGSPGLGKSTSAVWLARDLRVRIAFRDGIFFLEFGKERTAQQMLARLLMLIGTDATEAIRLERLGLPALSRAVQQWLRGKHCLLVLDDVWHDEQPQPYRQLASDSVTVLMTTRKSYIVELLGEELAGLPLQPFDKLIAEKLVVSISGKLNGELNAGALRSLVTMSAGVPAFLRSVGRMCAKKNSDVVLRFFETHKLEHRLPRTMAAADGYQMEAAKGNLFLAYEGHLDAIEEENELLARRCTMLGVFPEDTELAVDGLLLGLWDVSKAEAQEVVDLLVSEGLVETRADGTVITLLDPVRDYLRCRGKSSLPEWHAVLLRTCEVVAMQEPEDDAEPYWHTRHLLYHLHGCAGSLRDGLVPRLKTFYLDNFYSDRAPSLPPLHDLPSLSTIYLDGCSVASLPSLTGLPALRRLQLRGCSQLSQLPPLDALAGLHELILEACSKLTTLPSLNGLVALEALTVHSCSRLTALPSFNGLTLLQKLVVDDCSGLTALPSLDGLVALQRLELRNCLSLTALPSVESLKTRGLQEVLFDQHIVALLAN